MTSGAPETFLYDDARLGGTVTQRRTGQTEPKYVWADGLGDRRQVDLAYGLGELGLEPADAPVIVLTEGGRKAKAVRDAGHPAVGLVSASTLPSEHVLATLAGRTIVLWPDNDQVGRGFMGEVGRLLDQDAEAIHIIHWPDAPEHGDAADCTPDTIRELVAAAVAGIPTGGRAWRDLTAGFPVPGPVSPEPADDGSSEPEYLSPDVSPERGRNLIEAYRTAREIVSETPDTAEHIVQGLLYIGSLHELVGRAKAAGKTTFEAFMIRAILEGVPFLGRPTVATPVVLLSEQHGPSLRTALSRADLGERDDLQILRWADARAAPWVEIVESAIATCLRIGARALFVDTLPAFARVRGDAENDAGAALAAIEPLQAAAAGGLAVTVVRHERKGGGEVGDSGRGSSAFTGAVDVVLRLGRPDNPPRPTVRNLTTLSRFDDTPPDLVIELTEEGYVSLGDQAELALEGARSAILDVIPEPPSEGITEAKIQELVDGAKSTKITALRQLLSAGEVERHGQGKRGSPFVYVRTSADSGFVSEGPPLKGGVSSSGETNHSPVSVGDEMAAIFRDAVPDDVDEPADDELDAAATFSDEAWPWIN